MSIRFRKAIGDTIAHRLNDAMLDQMERDGVITRTGEPGEYVLEKKGELLLMAGWMGKGLFGMARDVMPAKKRA
jgi:hypothetical protein